MATTCPAAAFRCRCPPRDDSLKEPVRLSMPMLSWSLRVVSSKWMDRLDGISEPVLESRRAFRLEGGEEKREEEEEKGGLDIS